jgi:regulator of cell morphogenesis and NO signaling
MIIAPGTIVGELAAQFPQTIRVFQQLRIEFCREGHRKLTDLCRDRQLSFEEVAAALTNAVAAPAPLPRQDWTTRPLSDLTTHIVEAFHEPMRQELPRLHRMAVKVQRHRDPYKHVLAVVLYELELFTTDLGSHIAKTERELFPLIGRIEAGTRDEDDRGSFRYLRTTLEADHVVAGHALLILRNVTDRYAVPAHACDTLRTLYQGLKELEQLMQLHVHLENNVLFPRAADLLSNARLV